MVQGVEGSNPFSHPNFFNDLAVSRICRFANLRDFLRAFVPADPSLPVFSACGVWHIAECF